ALSVRVRTLNGSAYLTLKNRVPGPARAEFEYSIPLEDASALLEHCDQPLIEKIRHSIVHNGRTWIVDEFQNTRSGLVLADCELKAVDEIVDLPDWVGAEVTDNPAYRNEAL